MFGQWSLSKKLVAAGFLVGLLIPAFGYYFKVRSQEVREMNQEIRAVAQKNLSKKQLLGEMIFKFRSIRIEVRTIPLREISNEQIQTQIDRTKAAVGTFQESVKKFEPLIDGGNERRIFDELQKNFASFLDLGVEIIGHASNKDPAGLSKAAKLVIDVCPTKASAVEKSIQELIATQSDETLAMSEGVKKLEDQTIMIIFWGSLGAFLLAISMALLMGRGLSRMLGQLTNELVESSENVRVTSEKLTQQGQAVSAAASQQASAVQDTASAITQIDSMVAKNSENAEESQSFSNESLQQAKSGKELLEELTAQLQQIQTSANDLISSVEQGNQKIGKIVEMIKEIESKTKIINDIVFQTKLLSFNASVEAARAGEAGKGFAVVADEVGALANMSGQASKEISSLLEQSVSEIRKIVSEAQKTTDQKANLTRQQVEAGMSAGELCEKALQAILEKTQETSQKAAEIARASKEQSLGVTDVKNAISKINETTHESSSVAGNLLEESQLLGDQSDRLQWIVARFSQAIHGQKSTGAQTSPTATMRFSKPRIAEKPHWHDDNNQDRRAA